MSPVIATYLLWGWTTLIENHRTGTVHCLIIMHTFEYKMHIFYLLKCVIEKWKGKSRKLGFTMPLYLLKDTIHLSFHTYTLKSVLLYERKTQPVIMCFELSVIKPEWGRISHTLGTCPTISNLYIRVSIFWLRFRGCHRNTKCILHCDYLVANLCPLDWKLVMGKDKKSKAKSPVLYTSLFLDLKTCLICNQY